MNTLRLRRRPRHLSAIPFLAPIADGYVLHRNQRDYASTRRSLFLSAYAAIVRFRCRAVKGLLLSTALRRNTPAQIPIASCSF